MLFKISVFIYFLKAAEIQNMESDHIKLCSFYMAKKGVERMKVPSDCNIGTYGVQAYLGRSQR